MPSGIVENFDLLRQISTEFNLGANYDWFADSSAHLETFVNTKYVCNTICYFNHHHSLVPVFVQSPKYDPESAQNRGKPDAEKKKLKAKFDNAKRVIGLVINMYNLNDGGEMRKVFSKLRLTETTATVSDYYTLIIGDLYSGRTSA